MAGVTNKQRYEKSSIYEKKLLALHKAIRLIIVLRRMGIGGCFKGERFIRPIGRCGRGVLYPVF